MRSIVAHLGPALRACAALGGYVPPNTTPSIFSRGRSCRRLRRRRRLPSSAQLGTAIAQASTGDILTLGISSTARRWVMTSRPRRAPSSISCIVNRPGLFPARRRAHPAGCASPTNASKRCCVHRARGVARLPGLRGPGSGRRRPPARWATRSRVEEVHVERVEVRRRLAASAPRCPRGRCRARSRTPSCPPPPAPVRQRHPHHPRQE